MNFVRVEGFPKYVIHPVGTVLRIYKNHTKEMKPWKKKNGYMRIELSNNGKTKQFYVHRLLALYFIHNDDPENKLYIDHINDIRDDNRLVNLEWVTMTENNRRMRLNNPAAIITKGGIYKKKSASWEWRYYMKGKQKSKTMKNLKDLEQYKLETLAKYY